MLREGAGRPKEPVGISTPWICRDHRLDVEHSLAARHVAG